MRFYYQQSKGGDLMSNGSVKGLDKSVRGMMYL